MLDVGGEDSESNSCNVNKLSPLLSRNEAVAAVLFSISAGVAITRAGSVVSEVVSEPEMQTLYCE